MPPTLRDLVGSWHGYAMVFGDRRIVPLDGVCKDRPVLVLAELGTPVPVGQKLADMPLDTPVTNCTIFSFKTVQSLDILLVWLQQHRRMMVAYEASMEDSDGN